MNAFLASEVSACGSSRLYMDTKTNDNAWKYENEMVRSQLEVKTRDRKP